MARILVGFSGGVDSSSVVARLADEGHEVVAATLVMQHGSVPVPGEADLARARATALDLGVRHVVEDVSALFEREVVQPFVRAYAEGRTPNPCVVCNPLVKFRALRIIADQLDCALVATGHYARIAHTEGGARVAPAADAKKDQSYFLYRIAPSLLASLRFPLAEVEKSETRAFAEGRGLAAADAPESTGVCFAPAGDYRRLLAERMPSLLAAGDIVDERGEVLGTHRGSARYTLGQRKGLDLSGGPWFVTGIDAGSNTVTVSRDRDASKRRRFYLDDPVLWDELPSGGGEVLVQTRYHAEAEPARVSRSGARLAVELEGDPTFAAEGQSCVIFQDGHVSGGGFMSWS